VGEAVILHDRAIEFGLELVELANGFGKAIVVAFGDAALFLLHLSGVITSLLSQ
jgi:hypothetical protein